MLRSDLYQYNSATDPQCRRVLSLMVETDWVTVRDIAITTDWPKPTVDEVLDQLVADGFIEVIGTSDRQAAHLTPHGVEAVQILFDTRGAKIDDGDC